MKRNFVNKELEINSWKDIQPYFKDLLQREVVDEMGLRKWFSDRSELESVVSENLAWRYIKMTCYTDKEEYNESYKKFVTEIQPHIAPESDALNKKALESPEIQVLEKEEGFNILIRSLRKETELFRKENIPLFTELQTLAQEYSQIMGKMSIEYNGEELTMQQAGALLQETDRSVREKVYAKMSSRRLEDADKLEELFALMVSKRQKVAINAGFENFRDYKFQALGRFDYDPQDCLDFHDAVKEEVVPLLNEMAEKRRSKLNVDKLKPWDKSVDISGKPPLKPFEGGKDLLNKTSECFGRLDSFFRSCLMTMDQMGHLDLESRKGKAPGGYNYPLAESEVPFIFMNATSTVRDMVTLLHEGGHAVHSFLTQPLELNDFKSTPSEVAELASMSMELITMDYWDSFFNDEEELNRARKEHLEQIIETLPWVALIDKFQHWIYENYDAGNAERTKAWQRIFDDFTDSITDWSGLEKVKAHLWHRQLHLFEVPFYYIEYGMAQLGAIAVWKNYKEDAKKGLEGYRNALKLGYTRSIPEIYQSARIRFDFSRSYIKELMEFVKTELNKYDIT